MVNKYLLYSWKKILSRYSMTYNLFVLVNKTYLCFYGVDRSSVLKNFEWWNNWTSRPHSKVMAWWLIDGIFYDIWWKPTYFIRSCYWTICDHYNFALTDYALTLYLLNYLWRNCFSSIIVIFNMWQYTWILNYNWHPLFISC